MRASAPLFLRLPPPLWALILVAVAFGLGGAWTMQPLFRQRTLGVALIVLGLALAVWGRMVFAREGAEILPTSPTNSKLVQRGPFRLSRNPMYLGLLALLIGIALVVGTGPMLLVPPIFFAAMHWGFIPFEEAKMARQFGQEYGDYKRRVRRWL